MTSVEPSPPKRIKLTGGGQPPSKIPLLLRPQSQSQSQPQSQSSSSTSSSSTTTTTTTITTKTTNGKPAPVLAASSSLRFRRISSPRLSQSPVRKPAPAPATPNFFHNTDVGSSVTRMGSTAGSPQDQPTPTPTPRPPRPALAEKPSGNGNEKRPLEEEQQQRQEEEALKEPSPQPPPPPSPPPPRDKDEEALRRLLADRVAALKTEIEALKDEREREEARIERETSAARKAAAAAAAAAATTTPEGEGLQALLRRLLAANDASHTVLPELPKLGGGEGEEGEEEGEVVPSVRPRDSGDVGAFHCLTFTRTSCGIYTPAPNTTNTTKDNEAPLQKYTASGYALARLLAFTVSFLVDPRSASVHSLSTTVSAWARAELGAPLAAAEDAGDVAGALYALSSYAVMARRRAAVWARCERSFPELLRRGKGAAGGCGRRDLVRWLGRSVLVFCRKGGGAELVVGWVVGVDCVGEAESVLTADVRFPGGWKDADDRGSLRKVGEVFTALVKERGVFEAVRCVVGLVFQ